MSHRFTIEYDMSQGLFSRDDGRDKCLAVCDTLDEAEAKFPAAMEKVHDYYMELSYEKRKRAHYLVACFCWKVDEDGEITNEEGWDELTDDEKKRMNNLNVSYGL